MQWIPGKDQLGLPTWVPHADPSFRLPPQGRDPGVADDRAADNVRADAKLQLDTQLAQLQTDMARARMAQDAAQLEYDKFKDARTFEELQKQNSIVNGLNDKKFGLEEQKFQVDTELGYARSRQGDVAAAAQTADRTGYMGGAPTLDREKAAANAARDDLTAQSNAAYQAAQVALKMGDQDEFQRQCDISQELKQQVQDFDETIKSAEFQFKVQRSPASAVAQTFGLRGQQAPYERPALGLGGLYGRPDGGQEPYAQQAPGEQAGVQSAGGTAGFDEFGRQRQQGGGIATTAAPLSQDEIMNSPYTAPGVKYALGGSRAGAFASPIRITTGQRLASMLPSERAELGATVQAAGVNPEDYAAMSERLTGTAQPMQQRRTVARRRAPVSVY